MDIKLFSLDMFQTLADIFSLKYVIWQRILDNDFTRSLADRYWARSSELIFSFLSQPDFTGFEPIRDVFASCYEQLLDEIPHQFDPEWAAAVMCDHHPLCPIFSDTRPFLEWANSQAPVCLSSDTDEIMLGSLIELFTFDEVFTSEEIQAYKVQKNGRFFKSVLDFYRVSPQTVLHIGDSPSDVIGARQAGIKTCWVNRQNRPWTWGVKPDFVVTSLAELPSMLNHK